MNNTFKQVLTQTYQSSRVIRPLEFSGSVHGDFGIEINGVKSETSYASMTAAQNAINRFAAKMK